MKKSRTRFTPWTLIITLSVVVAIAAASIRGITSMVLDNHQANAAQAQASLIAHPKQSKTPYTWQVADNTWHLIYPKEGQDNEVTAIVGSMTIWRQEKNLRITAVIDYTDSEQAKYYAAIPTKSTLQFIVGAPRTNEVRHKLVGWLQLAAVNNGPLR